MDKNLAGRLVHVDSNEKDFSVSVNHDLNFDDPTHEETLEQQRMADAILFERELRARYPEHFQSGRYSLREASQLMHSAGYVRQNDLPAQIRWLRSAGYNKVCVKGISRRVPLEDADPRHVKAMYNTELGEVRKIAGKIH